MTALSENPYAPTMLLDHARHLQREADRFWKYAGRAQRTADGKGRVVKQYSRLVQANVAADYSERAFHLELESRMVEMEAWSLRRERIAS